MPYSIVARLRKQALQGLATNPVTTIVKQIAELETYQANQKDEVIEAIGSILLTAAHRRVDAVEAILQRAEREHSTGITTLGVISAIQGGVSHFSAELEVILQSLHHKACIHRIIKDPKNAGLLRQAAVAKYYPQVIKAIFSFLANEPLWVAQEMFSHVYRWTEGEHGEKLRPVERPVFIQAVHENPEAILVFLEELANLSPEVAKEIFLQTGTYAGRVSNVLTIWLESFPGKGMDPILSYYKKLGGQDLVKPMFFIKGKFNILTRLEDDLIANRDIYHAILEELESMDDPSFTLEVLGNNGRFFPLFDIFLSSKRPSRNSEGTRSAEAELFGHSLEIVDRLYQRKDLAHLLPQIEKIFSHQGPTRQKENILRRALENEKITDETLKKLLKLIMQFPPEVRSKIAESLEESHWKTLAGTARKGSGRGTKALIDFIQERRENLLESELPVGVLPLCQAYFEMAPDEDKQAFCVLIKNKLNAMIEDDSGTPSPEVYAALLIIAAKENNTKEMTRCMTALIEMTGFSNKFLNANRRREALALLTATPLVKGSHDHMNQFIHQYAEKIKHAIYLYNLRELTPQEKSAADQEIAHCKKECEGYLAHLEAQKANGEESSIISEKKHVVEEALEILNKVEPKEGPLNQLNNFYSTLMQKKKGEEYVLNQRRSDDSKTVNLIKNLLKGAAVGAAFIAGLPLLLVGGYYSAKYAHQRLFGERSTGGGELIHKVVPDNIRNKP